MIAAFVGGKLPSFIFVNKRILNSFAGYQIEVNGHVLQTLKERVTEIENLNIKGEGTFTISDEVYENYNNSIPSDIDKLIKLCKDKALKPKDIIVLKLYFTFMGKDYTQNKHTNSFMR